MGIRHDSSDPLVSVVIPTYYRNDRLRAALHSVLKQRYRPIEVIVVDDSGEGHASSVVESFPRVDYLELNENRGAQAARSCGLDQAEGTYVNLLDDDDRLKPDKIEKQVDLIEANPDVGVVYCGKQWESGHRIMPDPDVRGEILRYALEFQTTPSSPSAMLIDRAVLEEIRPLAERPGGDDLGMKIELAKRTKFDFVDEVLLTQGDDDSSRGGSIGAVTGRRQILSEYEALYESEPDSVRRNALAHTYLLEAEIRLNQSYWSPRAVKSALLALYYVPGFPLSFTGFAAASLFGRPGKQLARGVYDRVVLGDEHQGGVT